MDTKTASCLLISKVLVADGIMTDAERGFLTRYMDQLGLDEAARKRVIALDGWDEADQAVSAMSAAERQAVLDQASDAALVDGNLSPLELAAVKKVAQALGLG